MLRSLACLAAVASCASAWDAQVTGSFAKSWDVKYYTNYKVLNVTAGGSSYHYVLTKAGVATPTKATLVSLGRLPASATPKFFTAPISKASLLSTTQIQWAELLGLRNKIASIPGKNYVSSTCVKTLVTRNAIADSISADGYSTNMDALAPADAVFCTPGWGCPGTAKDVVFPDITETSLMGIADMASYMSLFFNIEAKANTLTSDIKARLDCTSNVISTAAAVSAAFARRQGLPVPTKPRVLWAYNYGGSNGWYVGSCPNYYCDAIAAAGGSMVIPTTAGTGQWGAYSDEQMGFLVARSDIWLYASDNWDSQMAPALASGTGIGEILAAAPAVQSRRVFDFMRRGTNAWFEERPAQPDRLVQDLASIISPNAAALAGAFSGATGTTPAVYNRYWWRNAQGEARGAPSTVCADVAAAANLASQACPRRGSPTPLPSASATRRAATRTRTATRKVRGGA